MSGGMFLGLDLGTSGLRALLVAADGTVIGEAEQGYGVAHDHAGWSEQAPADWVDAAHATISALTSFHPKEMVQLKGIGFSGHMHGATLIDVAGDVLRPCMMWNDTRAHAEAALLDGTPEVRALSGNIVFPGFTAPKVMWVKNNEPEIFAHVATVLLPKDYMVFWLTGERVSDMSDAAGTSWLDVGKRNWSDKLLAASGMRADQMPRLLEGNQVAGTVRPELAAQLGLPADVQVVAGGGDNAVAACGVGTLNEGDGFVSLGTSGVVLAARDKFAPMPETAVHSFCHAVPDTWYQMGVMLAATDSLNWLSGVLGKPPAELTKALGDTISGPGDVRFLPYLSGERTPHNDSVIRGAFIGLDITSGADTMTQAVLEGVSFGLRDSLEALRATGANPKRLLGIGGGMQSAYWAELLATIFNLEIDLPEKGEFGAALGAARLAISGVTGAPLTHIMTKPKVGRTISPRAEYVDAYEVAYQKFSASYAAVKAVQ